ncbi:MAG TPA: hypothetical protein VMZ69_04150 [Saprospiraceae bacterium]|nr:hypothetical protein [Saprospiraceae bacterium]
MKPALLLYLRIFFFMGLGFGLFMFLTDALSGEGLGAKSVFLRGFLFGTFMSLILVTFHLIRLRYLGIKEFTTEILRPSQKKILQSDISKQELISKLKSDPVVGKMQMNENGNEISLKSGMNLWGFGENISIKINPKTIQSTEYEIESTPIMKTTLVDFGKNLQNVNRIEKLIV